MAKTVMGVVEWPLSMVEGQEMNTPSNANGRSSQQKRKLKTRLFGGRLEASCCFCRKKLQMENATLEHVVPISFGGSWAIENLRLSCGICNSERGIEDFEEFRKKKRRN